MTEFIEVGKIVNTHGLRGEVKLYSYGNNHEFIQKAKVLIVGRDKVEYPIVYVKPAKNLLRVKLQGVDRIEDAQELKEFPCYIPEDRLPELEDDEYYIHDLLGFQIITESGEPVGTLKNILNNQANDLFEIQEGDHTWLLPAVKAFIQEISLSEKRIYVKLIEGLRHED